MGILNVTPDSFSDGGRFLDPRAAIERGLSMVAEGADVIDVGGESTRPGSQGVSEAEELERVLPVVAGLKERCEALLSIDTVKPAVAREAVDAGAGMINDVSTLRNGVGLAEVAAESGAELVIMHSRKQPVDMQQDIAYADLIGEVRQELLAAAERAEAVGVTRDKIWIDPGIGFAKTARQCVELIANIPAFTATGHPVLVGPSRKSFIGALTGASVDDRLGGTAAAVTAAVLGGARGIRVHDVKMMRQAVQIASLAATTRRDVSA
jgi:dihydropteroate synthase